MTRIDTKLTKDDLLRYLSKFSYDSPIKICVALPPRDENGIPFTCHFAEVDAINKDHGDIIIDVHLTETDMSEYNSQSYYYEDYSEVAESTTEQGFRRFCKLNRIMKND